MKRLQFFLPVLILSLDYFLDPIYKDIMDWKTIAFSVGISVSASFALFVFSRMSLREDIREIRNLIIELHTKQESTSVSRKD